MVKKRILILLPSHQIFGQEQALITLASELQSQEIEFEFLVHKKWGFEVINKLTEMGFKCVMVPFGTIWSLSLSKNDLLLPVKNIIAIFATTLKLFIYTKRNSATHVIIGNASFGYYMLPFLYLLKKKLTVIYRHGDEMACHSVFHSICNKILLRVVDKHVVNCLYLKDYLKKIENSVKIDLIYNLPSKIINAMSNVAEVTPTRSTRMLSLLFVGQISEQKGIDLLFDAFFDIVKIHNNIKLTVVGEIPGYGSARSQTMQKYIDNLSAEYPRNIFFVGYQSNLLEYYRAADLLICPSITNEPSANVVLEAKCAGLPVVAFDVGGMSELIEHHVDGYVCPSVTQEALANGILEFLKDKNKIGQASIMAKKNFLQKFGVERYRIQWLKVIND